MVRAGLRLAQSACIAANDLDYSCLNDVAPSLRHPGSHRGSSVGSDPCSQHSAVQIYCTGHMKVWISHTTIGQKQKERTKPRRKRKAEMCWTINRVP